MRMMAQQQVTTQERDPEIGQDVMTEERQTRTATLQFRCQGKASLELQAVAQSIVRAVYTLEGWDPDVCHAPDLTDARQMYPSCRDLYLATAEAAVQSMIPARLTAARNRAATQAMDYAEKHRLGDDVDLTAEEYVSELSRVAVTAFMASLKGRYAADLAVHFPTEPPLQPSHPVATETRRLAGAGASTAPAPEASHRHGDLSCRPSTAVQS